MNKLSNVGGGGIAVSGCVFWIALIVFVFVCLPAFASAPIVGPILESSADNAAAKRAKEQAEADRAEAACVQAEAAADSLRAYTDAGITAIETDRKHAHPLAWLEETLVKVLTILSIPLSLALLALAVVYYKDPETARRIVGALVTLRPKRWSGADGDYRDGPTQSEIVNLQLIGCAVAHQGVISGRVSSLVGGARVVIRGHRVADDYLQFRPGKVYYRLAVSAASA